MTEYDPRRPTPTHRRRSLLILPSQMRTGSDIHRSAKKAYRSGNLGQECHWCHHRFSAAVRATREHLVPRSQGGTNDAQNVVGACYTCNHNRGVIPADEWRVVIDEVMAAHPEIANDEIGPRARRLWVRRHREVLPPDPDDYRPPWAS